VLKAQKGHQKNNSHQLTSKAPPFIQLNHLQKIIYMRRNTNNIADNTLSGKKMSSDEKK
jgi:hypothetical protein